MNDDVVFLGMNMEEIFSRRDLSPLSEVDWTLPPRYDEHTDDGFLITTKCDFDNMVNSKDLKFFREDELYGLKGAKEMTRILPTVSARKRKTEQVLTLERKRSKRRGRGKGWQRQEVGGEEDVVVEQHAEVEKDVEVEVHLEVEEDEPHTDVWEDEPHANVREDEPHAEICEDEPYVDTKLLFAIYRKRHKTEDGGEDEGEGVRRGKRK
ncbi:hypothetical protein RHGRI_019459 [Rhododendron griersonianum]|uniref:Uncharacterized protein n=1 Tax=Rhododendron griersonianum TaxID=479676 RepID=A0AAV6JCQ1_9ERIC|nr:hypothetical protein RHGRI_019459 [Rhododendron griersonianum]